MDRIEQTKATLAKWLEICEIDKSLPMVMINKSFETRGKFHISMEDDIPRKMIVDAVVGSFLTVPGFEQPFLERISEIIGATRAYPEGKLNDTDDGALRMSIGTDQGRVIMDFGTRTSWIGMNPSDALRMAKSLIQKAESINQG